MDPLSPLIDRFALSARVFYSGALCGIVDFDNTHGVGILHVLRRGRVRVVRPNLPNLELEQPSLLFYRDHCPHRFEVDDNSGADLVCAFVDFGSGSGNPVLKGLPEHLLVSMTDLAGMDAALELLFDEAFAARSGRQAALNRLMEFLVVLLLRHTVDAGTVAVGTLAALADPRLAKAMKLIHEQPGRAWTVDDLAAEAGMSRASFAASFRDRVGASPMDYLTDWRIGVAQTMLRAGRPPKAVAPAVGYSSAAAFARVFTRHVGVSPAVWLAR
jgi:AraC-like DNA-binding protein